MRTQLQKIKLVRSKLTDAQPSLVIFCFKSASVGLVKAPTARSPRRSRMPKMHPPPPPPVFTGPAIGWPQCGHEGAWADTCFPQAGHAINDIAKSSVCAGRELGTLTVKAS